MVITTIRKNEKYYFINEFWDGRFDNDILMDMPSEQYILMGHPFQETSCYKDMYESAKETNPEMNAAELTKHLELECRSWGEVVAINPITDNLVYYLTNPQKVSEISGNTHAYSYMLNIRGNISSLWD